MALVGRLEDLRLAELFQLIALFRKSGKLTLSRGDTTGVFLFNDGKVFHASNGYSAPSLGEFLVEKNWYATGGWLDLIVSVGMTFGAVMLLAFYAGLSGNQRRQILKRLQMAAASATD